MGFEQSKWIMHHFVKKGNIFERKKRFARVGRRLRQKRGACWGLLVVPGDTGDRPAERATVRNQCNVLMKFASQNVTEIAEHGHAE